MKSLLVLNSGSSSLKFAVFVDGRKKLQGEVEGLPARPAITIGIGNQPRPLRGGWPEVFNAVAQTVQQAGYTPASIAHRIVHGGPLASPIRLTLPVLRMLKKYIPLAPLHMPPGLNVVQLSQSRWPAAQHWGVLDTSLYRDLPDASKLYALPRRVAQRFQIRKYGFHGTSHAWAMQQAAKKLHIQPKRFSGVTLHLGSGDSLTLWQHGRPVDTSMGFTPNEGLTMATRSGDLDPSIPLFLQERGLSIARVKKILTEESGLYGLSGFRDFRDVLAAIGHPVGNRRARVSAARRRQSRQAFDIFLYDIRRYLASYLGLLQRPQAIVFTGLIGQNAWVRRQIVRGTPAARGVRTLIVPADEETAIAAAVEKW